MNITFLGRVQEPAKCAGVPLRYLLDTDRLVASLGVSHPL
jgi:hypothetical protein